MFVDEGLVDLVDDSIQRGHCVFRDLTEKNIVVVLTIGVHCFTLWCSSKEVYSLSSKLDFLTIGDMELFLSSDVQEFTRFGDLVACLVVNKDSGRPVTFKKCCE